MDIGSRLRELRRAFGMNQSEFAERLAIRQNYLSNYENGVSGFPDELKLALNKISDKKINLDWLLTGEGAMFLAPAGQAEEEESTALEEVFDSIPVRRQEGDEEAGEPGQGVPFYDINIAAHIAGLLDDPQVQPDFYVDFKPFNDCSAYLPVYGDSMHPAISSGDIIAVKRLNSLEAILWGEAHVVITDSDSNDLRTVKLVFPHLSDHSKLILRSVNPAFTGDTVISKNSILFLYLVKGVIQRKHL